MPKFDRKTIALRNLKFETHPSHPTKTEICQGHLGNNNTLAISIGEGRSHPYFLAVTLRQFAKPSSVTR
ncbi:hypothetical protein QUB37_04890 [Microcoleus sp. AT3-A2]|uniref:hypothetical protein n=1 Tax=Microcoleus sp. AT3-A2 TaxID=2818610 RepID=UPI002FD33372